MDSLHSFFEGLSPMMQGLVGSMFTWFVTALGASMVFFVKDLNRGFMDVLMGFTGGVMLAASFWSLLNPAIGMAETQGFGNMAWLPVGIGFLAGAFFLFALDQYLPHLHLSAPDRTERRGKNQMEPNHFVGFGHYPTQHSRGFGGGRGVWSRG